MYKIKLLKVPNPEEHKILLSDSLANLQTASELLQCLRFPKAIDCIKAHTDTVVVEVASTEDRITSLENRTRPTCLI